MSDGERPEGPHPLSQASFPGDPVLFPFSHPRGLGRVAIGGMFLGGWLIFHSCLLFNALQNDQIILIRWAIYGLILGSFHSLEFFAQALYKPLDLSFESFVLDHSQEYMVAVLVSALEFWLELYVVASWKVWGLGGVWSVLGGFVGVLGLLVRFLAVRTAGSNFSHIVELEKRPSHELVTSGVYRCCRHPAYFGWWWFAISTQLLLSNPISLLLYIAASTLFFTNRLEVEEPNLIKFFGTQYIDYAASTATLLGSGIPLVPGSKQLLRAIENRAKKAEE